VVIQGNHTFSVAAGFAAQLTQYVTFSALAGDAFTIQAAAASQAIIAMKFCGIEAITVPGQRAVVMDATATGACQFSTDNANISSSSHCFEGIGAGSQEAFIGLGNCNSQSGNVFEATTGSNSLSGQYTTLNGSIYIFNAVSGGSCTFIYSNLFSAQEAGFYPAGVGSFDATHCTISSTSASGFWADGVAGASVSYSSIILAGSAQAVGPALSVFKPNWQPYAETAGGAVGSNRGTASFDSASFAVTDGFVQATGNLVTSIGTDSGIATPIAGVFNIFGGPGVTTIAAANDIYVRSVEWNDVAAPTLALVDNGYFDLGPTTITLPVAPAQGEQVRVISVNSGTIVQASGAQVITVGNVTSSPGGTATGTDTGDCLVLIYNLGLDRWIAESVLGNWSLA